MPEADLGLQEIQPKNGRIWCSIIRKKQARRRHGQTINYKYGETGETQEILTIRARCTMGTGPLLVS